MRARSRRRDKRWERKGEERIAAQRVVRVGHLRVVMRLGREMRNFRGEMVEALQLQGQPMALLVEGEVEGRMEMEERV